MPYAGKIRLAAQGISSQSALQSIWILAPPILSRSSSIGFEPPLGRGPICTLARIGPALSLALIGSASAEKTSGTSAKFRAEALSIRET